MPLVDLLRGCLKYLLEHMQQGQKVGVLQALWGLVQPCNIPARAHAAGAKGGCAASIVGPGPALQYTCSSTCSRGKRWVCCEHCGAWSSPAVYLLEHMQQGQKVGLLPTLSGLFALAWQLIQCCCEQSCAFAV